MPLKVVLTLRRAASEPGCASPIERRCVHKHLDQLDARFASRPRCRLRKLRMPFAPLEVNALGNSDCIDNGANRVAATEQIANLLLQFRVEEAFSSARARCVAFVAAKILGKGIETIGDLSIDSIDASILLEDFVLVQSE